MRFVLEPATQLDTTHLGHHDIADYDIHARRGTNFQRAPRRVRDKYFVALRLNQIAQQIELHLVVVDDQHCGRVFRDSIHRNDQS